MLSLTFLHLVITRDEVPKQSQSKIPASPCPPRGRVISTFCHCERLKGAWQSLVFHKFQIASVATLPRNDDSDTAPSLGG